MSVCKGSLKERVAKTAAKRNGVALVNRRDPIMSMRTNRGVEPRDASGK
jgi:hypothetical protein